MLTWSSATTEPALHVLPSSISNNKPLLRALLLFFTSFVLSSITQPSPRPRFGTLYPTNTLFPASRAFVRANNCLRSPLPPTSSASASVSWILLKQPIALKPLDELLVVALAAAAALAAPAPAAAATAATADALTVVPNTVG